jgi:hypothetical protein
MGVRTRGPFPRRSLRDLDGEAQPLAAAWSGGEALFLVGHGDCSTTRLALPFVDRIHRRRGEGRAVRLILQDDADSARALGEELSLAPPILVEEDPYPLARELGLEVVPTLFVVGGDGEIARVAEGWDRAAIEAVAERMGVPGPLFTPGEAVPAFRPG